MSIAASRYWMQGVAALQLERLGRSDGSRPCLLWVVALGHQRHAPLACILAGTCATFKL